MNRIRSIYQQSDVCSRQPSARCGSVAMYLVMIISVLLLTTTVLAARQSLSETRQSSDIDQSAAAYYAAEAGLEEANRRLDINSDTRLDLKDIFPEQWKGGVQHGDRAILTDSNGNSNLGNAFNIRTDTRSQHSRIKGRLAWRQRRVYEEPRTPVGTLVKDETVELDTTELRRECLNGQYKGEKGEDCDGHKPIFDRFRGVEFCWTPRPNAAEMEFTVLSYPNNDPASVRTEKFLTNAGQGQQVSNKSGLTLQGISSANEPYQECVELKGLDISRRYIFRIRALFPQNVTSRQEAQNQASTFRVDYRTRLLDRNSPNNNPLFIPDSTVLIDVVGQSGDIRRRIIARKQRKGRILGVFDYVLYSGDSGKGALPLCKVGVQQSERQFNGNRVPGAGYDINSENCQPIPADNN